MSGFPGAQQRTTLHELDPARKRKLAWLLASVGYRGTVRMLRTSEYALDAMRAEGFTRKATLDRLAARLDEVTKEDDHD